MYGPRPSVTTVYSSALSRWQKELGKYDF
jgi:hypothetical protein